MSYLHTEMMIQEIINRIDDYNHDPEPQYDSFLQEIPVHTKLTLEYALKLALSEYKRETST